MEHGDLEPFELGTPNVWENVACVGRRVAAGELPEQDAGGADEGTAIDELTERPFEPIGGFGNVLKYDERVLAMQGLGRTGETGENGEVAADETTTHCPLRTA